VQTNEIDKIHGVGVIYGFIFDGCIDSDGQLC